ncbi:MAG: type II toxin-antitoxin system ParD family antitoxin [Thermodesulfobacteriota bacterium]
MDVVLPPQMDEWIAGKVKAGVYKSSSEVVFEGLRLLKRQDEQRQAMLDDLRQELLLGLRQLDSGLSVSFDSKQIDEIKTEGRKRQGI